MQGQQRRDLVILFFKNLHRETFVQHGIEHAAEKTVEGAVGGVLGGIAGMLVYCLVLSKCFSFTVNYWYALVYGVLGALAAMFGDLSFSAIKRQNGIKDYGNLIPGHGGVLDRFDSMTLVAPLAEILLILLPIAVR